MKVLACYGVNHSIYDAVTDIRRDGGAQTRFTFDQYSHHYVVWWENKPLGSLTVQEATHGDLDCQGFYPPALLEQYRTQIISTCKLRIRTGPTTPILALRTLIRAAWQDQYRRGKRIALVNAEHRMRSFYHRIGFSYLSGYDFVHPDLNTQSCVLLMAADPGHRSYCQDIFKDASPSYSQDDLVALCTESQTLLSDPAMLSLPVAG